MSEPNDDLRVDDALSGADLDSDSPLVARLFAKLADGEFHSGETLAAELAVSRSAIWKAAGALKDLGATVHAVRNRGYRLPGTAEPLDAARMTELLSEEARPRVARIDTAWTLGSTNTALMERPHPRVGTGEALLAEYQTAGRGRRGRTWVAPPGGAICLSFSWVFGEVPRDLGALGLVIGVCAMEALQRLGVVGVGLKWPNDLLINDRKLGGILIELRAESSGPACVVIGIGLNIAQLSAGYKSEKARAQVTLHYGDIPAGSWSGTFKRSRQRPIDRLPSVFRKILAGSELCGLPEAQRSSLRPAPFARADSATPSSASCSAFRTATWSKLNCIDSQGK